MRPNAGRLWPLLLVVVLVACGGPPASTTTTTGQPAPVSSTGARPPVTGSGATAGRVTSVHDQQVMIDNVIAGDGTDVRTGSTVTSDGNGSFDLSVGASVHRCLTDHDSVLRVRPNAATLIAWTQGSSWCEKSGGGQAQFGIGPGLVASMSDPVFRVQIDGSGTVLKVDEGFVRVRSANATVVVGPGQQVSVLKGGAPAAVKAIEKDAQDNVNFGPLRGLAPGPNFGRPPSGGSGALTRIFRSGTIHVRMVGPSGVPDQQSIDFARAFFDDLAQHWKLHSDFSVPDATTGSTGTGSIAAPATTPIDVQVGAKLSGSLPFFSDGRIVWRLAGSDSGLQGVLRNFLVSYLNNGDYANLYANNFGGPPPYGPVASLIVPG